jgi:hypothetical protein
MPEYRFYTLSKDGRIAGPATIHDLPDDAAAVRHAERLVEDRPVEIWLGARKVAKVEPEPT